MHTRLFGTSILALTLAAVLSAACTKSSENPGTTGTTGTGSASAFPTSTWVVR